jgi:hypothetical protein
LGVHANMSLSAGTKAGGDATTTRRKSSAQQQALEKALESPLAQIEASELSEADRKLAELGYVQVSPDYFLDRMLAISNRLTVL